MDKRISDIMNDLYKIDPQFKAHEQELRTLVSSLVLSKPDTHFDESFAAKLRAELLETKVKPMPSPYSSFFASRMFFGLVGSALTILIVVPFTFVATQKATSPDKPVVINPFSDQVKDVSTGLTPTQQISNKGMNAFGKLALVPTTENQPETPPDDNANGVSARSIQPLSTSAASAPTAASPKAKVSVSARATNTLAVVYKGDAITLKDTQGKVFKRTKGADSGKQLFDMVQNGKFGLTDLTSFSDLKLKDVELSQDIPFGYVVGINLDEGAININPQWQFWTVGNTTTPVTEVTPLDAHSLISIANDFLKSHSITTTVYADPVAMPESSTVIFPLKIDSKEVSEQTGIPFGLVVTVDAGQKKVSGISNLTSQIYDSSQYTLETNFDTIVHVATSSLSLPGSKGETATLGTPKAVLMHYWLNDGGANIGDELFIPALSFPITYSSNNTNGPTAIVVPLVKDFLAKATTQPVSGNATTIAPLHSTKPQ